MDLNSLSPLPQSISRPVDFEIEKIRGIIADYVGVSMKRVIDNANLRDDLGLDWLERLELLLRIEHETGIEISESDATHIENVGNLLRHIDFLIKPEGSGKPRSEQKPQPRRKAVGASDATPRSAARCGLK